MRTDFGWLTRGSFVVGLNLVVPNLAVPTLVVVSLAACSSSTSLKRTGDAAPAPEGGMADLIGPDVAGPEAGGPDAARPDAARAEVLAPDTALPGKDAIGSADLPAGKDTAQSDLPAGTDATRVDLPTTAVDAPAGDGSSDVPAGDGALRDGAGDAWNCTTADAGPVPCNDDPNSEAIMGTCQADGTCACTSYFVLNPSTGRCMFPPRDASVRDDTGVGAACTGEYNACGCGCCSVDPRTLGCYYPSLGETVAAIMAKDEAAKNSPTCATAGCAAGVRYVCCAELAPESPSSATYAVDAYSGGLDHVTISKVGDGCASVSFARPLTSGNAALKITVPSSWGVSSAGFGACGDGGATDPVTDAAKGAVGTFTLRASGGQCVADLHATLFAFAADRTVKATRLDVDGLAVTGLPSGLCR